jgi:hypothetical protein
LSNNPIFLLLSPHAYKLIIFSDADRYETWHDAIKDEIQVLRFNGAWFLVSSYPLMNVIGSSWVYKIKYRVDGIIENYKAQLVARRFT